MRVREETVTTPPSEESEPVVTTPPSHHREDSPADYPPKDQPDTPLGSEDGSVIPPADSTQCVPPGDPISGFWSGQTADTSDKNKRRHRWLIRKPENRHSIEVAELERQVLDLIDQNFIVDAWTQKVFHLNIWDSFYNT